VNLLGGTLNLTGVTGGTIAVNGPLNAGALSTAVAFYNVTLGGGGAISGRPPPSNNIGTLTIAAGFNFLNGATDTLGLKSFWHGHDYQRQCGSELRWSADVTDGEPDVHAGNALVTLGPTIGPVQPDPGGKRGGDNSHGEPGNGDADLAGVLAGATVTVTGALTAQAVTTAAAALQQYPLGAAGL